MGRTLHYSIVSENGKKFTDADFTAFKQITKKYNSVTGFWTCESLCIDPIDYYPNWDKFRSVDKNILRDRISADKAVLESGGMSETQAILKMEKDGLIKLFDEKWRTQCHGFVKVQGNEANSLAVLTALIELSAIRKNLRITLNDEGEFLYCDVTIAHGKILPDLEQLFNDLKHWQAIAWQEKNPMKLEGIHENIAREIDNTCYCKYALGRIKGIKEKLVIISQAISKNWKHDFQMNRWNMGTLKPEQWFAPHLFHRYVDTKKFTSYKGGAIKLMDGFQGEGFGLAPDDDSESLKMLANMQKLFEKAGIKKEDVKILPEVD